MVYNSRPTFGTNDEKDTADEQAYDSDREPVIIERRGTRGGRGGGGTTSSNSGYNNRPRQLNAPSRAESDPYPPLNEVLASMNSTSKEFEPEKSTDEQTKIDETLAAARLEKQ